DFRITATIWLRMEISANEIFGQSETYAPHAEPVATCNILRRLMNNPIEDLLRISMSHGVPRCLHAVAELGIADALGESPRSADELARDTSTNADALARTLRVLSA